MVKFLANHFTWNAKWSNCASELLAAMEKATGAADKGSKRDGKGGKIITQSNGATALPTIKELGISKDQSSRWQQLAKNPKDQ